MPAVEILAGSQPGLISTIGALARSSRVALGLLNLTVSERIGLAQFVGNVTVQRKPMSQEGSLLRVFCWICFDRIPFVLTRQSTLAVCSRCGTPEGAMQLMNSTELAWWGLCKDDLRTPSGTYSGKAWPVEGLDPEVN